MTLYIHICISFNYSKIKYIEVFFLWVSLLIDGNMCQSTKLVTGLTASGTPHTEVAQERFPLGVVVE